MFVETVSFGSFNLKFKEPTPMDGCEYIMDLVEIDLGEKSLRLGAS